MAALVGDLVDANGLDAGQIHVLTAPGYRHLDRAEHTVPGGMEDFGDFFP